MSSYGVFCGSFGRPVLVVEQRVGDAAVRLVHADDVAAGRERARVSAACGRCAARLRAACLSALRHLRRLALALAASTAAVRRRALPRLALLPGTVTVNGAVAREISTPCFCSTRSSSACAPGRGSSPGSTYAAGPSVFAFRIERLLFR